MRQPPRGPPVGGPHVGEHGGLGNAHALLSGEEEELDLLPAVHANLQPEPSLVQLFVRTPAKFQMPFLLESS